MLSGCSVRDLLAASGAEDAVPDSYLFCLCDCVWRTLHDCWQYDQGTPPAGPSEGRQIRNVILSNNRKIHIITSSVKRDRNESLYNLERFDDEISQLEQDMDDMLKKKKDALNSFENVTRMIISDEITENSREKLERMAEEYEDAVGQLKYVRTILQEKRMYMTDTYESYLGREFLNVEKIERPETPD